MSMELKDLWIVDVKGEAETGSWEISVIRSTNIHGQESYGWIDSTKLLIGSSGGPRHNTVIKIVWDGLIKLAEETRDHLNAKDSQTKEALERNARAGARITTPDERLDMLDMILKPMMDKLTEDIK